MVRADTIWLTRPVVIGEVVDPGGAAWSGDARYSWVRCVGGENLAPPLAEQEYSVRYRECGEEERDDQWGGGFGGERFGDDWCVGWLGYTVLTIAVHT